MQKITIFTAGVSRGNPGPAAIGISIVDAQGNLVKEVAETIGNATSTFAEYQAVLRGLQTVGEQFSEKTRDMEIELKLGSELVQKQLSGEAQIKEPGLVPHFIEIHNMRVSSFPNITFTPSGPEFNKEAERLADEAFGDK
jgi:ribonuclease HI